MQPLVQLALQFGDRVVSGDSALPDPFARGVEIAAMALMLLGTQWYILFNVIAGAMAIPTDLKEAARIFKFSSMEPLALPDFAGNFPLPCHRDGDGVRRRVEMPVSWRNIFTFRGNREGSRPGKHDQQRQRRGLLICCWPRRDHGGDRGADQPAVVEKLYRWRRRDSSWKRSHHTIAKLFYPDITIRPT